MRKASPDLLLVSVAVVWGGSYLSAKQLVGEVGVEPALALRYGIGAIGMLAFALFHRARRPDSRLLWSGIGLGCSQAATLCLETAGVGRTSATNAGVLISLSLVLTPLLEVALLRRRLPLSFYLAALTAILGVGFLSSGAGGLRMPNSGDLLILCAALLRAVHVAATSRIVRPTDSVVALVSIQMLLGTVLFGAVAAPSAAAWLPALSPAGIGQAIFLGLGCSVFAFLVQAWAVQQTSAARASLLMGTEPLWAALIGIGVGGEPLGWIQGGGALLIVLGATAGAILERRVREGSSGLRSPAERRVVREPLPVDLRALDHAIDPERREQDAHHQ